MKLEKQEIIDIVKANGLNEEEAEKLLEMLSKKVGGALVDVIKLAVSKTENSIDDMLVMAGESTLRKMIDEIDINL
jgi:hypothetical protein